MFNDTLTRPYILRTTPQLSELIQKVEGQLGRIIGIHLLGRDEGFITINEDRTLRILLKRDNGQYWPSVIQDLVQLPTRMHCDEETQSVYVGLLSGVVVEYSFAEDMNTLQQRRQWQAHTNAISGLASSALLKQVYWRRRSIGS